MGLTQRPYIGTWKLNQKKVIQYTPDCLVYVNGDLSIPGDLSGGGRRRIQIQPYLTAISVDAGTDPGGASANISLSIPVHSNDPFIRDAEFILRPGLEIHVYMRGYFPVRGLFRNASDYVDQESGIYDQTAQKAEEQSKGAERDKETGEQAQLYGGDTFNSTTQASLSTGLDVRHGDYTDYGAMMDANPQYDDYISLAAAETGVPPDVLKATMALESNFKYCPPNKVGATGLMQLKAKTAKDRAKSAGYDPAIVDEAFLLENNEANIRMGALHLKWLAETYYTDPNTGEVDWYATLAAYNQGHGPVNAAFNCTQGQGCAYDGPGMTAKKHHYATSVLSTVQNRRDDNAGGLLRSIATDQTESTPKEPVLHRKRPSDDLMAYPYYHVFHGVVTQADHAYSGGFQTASLNCGSMLYFWSYHAMSTSAAYFGARPIQSKLRTSLIGHNFTGWHPYEIIYKLYRDVGGAAQGVGWTLSQKTNQAAKIGKESLFSLNLKYWQQRFNTTMMKLRMHGATGYVYNAAQSTFLGRLSTSAVNALYNKRLPKSKGSDQSYRLFSAASTLGLVKPEKRKAVERGTVQEAAFATASHEGSSAGVNLFEMMAFVKDIGQMGQVNLFESTYETKMDIAQKVCEITGFEFYQDVDGDLVFKPPMYNLDTSTSRIYRIEDIDVISLNFSEKEPEVTYMTVKGSQFKNLLGTGAENEWGVQGQYIDYRLVAQFGWRGQSFETAYFNSRRAMYYAAVNRMDILNAGTKYASLTIPLRPELRPGYPVYIRYLDCYYYCTSFSHSFQFGGQCTTSLQLIGKRAKFFAPGLTEGSGIETIKLNKPYLPRRPLGVIDNKDGIKKKRLMGFPNVVMALDPDEVNPLYSLVGDDIEDISNTKTLNALLKLAAAQENIITEVLDENNTFTGMYTYQKDEKGDVITILVGEEPPEDSSKVINLQKVATAYTELQEKTANTVVIANAKVSKLKNKLGNLEQDVVAFSNHENPDVQAKVGALGSQIVELEQLIANAQYDRDILLEKAGQTESSIEGIEILTEVIKLAGVKLKSENDDYKDYEKSHKLLDLLGDKKAVFSNKSTPGTYRYYSCSHPDADQQGNVSLEGDRLGWGFLPDTSCLEDPKPEALFKESVTVQKGLHVQTGSGRRIVPTSEIKSITFAVIDVKRSGKKATKAKDKTKLPPFLKDAITQASLRFDAVARKGRPTDTLDQVFQGVWESMAEQITKNQSDVTPGVYPSYSEDDLYKGTIAEILARPAVRKKGYKQKTKLLRAKATEKGNEFGAALQQSYSNYYAKAEALGKAEQESTEDPNQMYRKIRMTMAKANVAIEKFVKLSVAKGGKASKKAGNAVVVESPVFPVSDAQGFEVIGSYPYGRGVGISKDNVLNQILNADPLAAVDQAVIEAYLDALYKKGKGSKDYEIAKGNLVTAVDSLYSHQELLDIGVLEQAGGQLRYRLENFFADQRDSVQKLSVGNAAYSLADLNFHLDTDTISDIRPQEAGVLMEAMSTSFAEVLGTQDLGVIETFAEIEGIEGLSEPDRAQALAIAQKRADWEEFQRTIRGRASEVPSQSTLDVINDSIKKFKTGTQITNAQASVISQSAQNLTEE